MRSRGTPIEPNRHGEGWKACSLLRVGANRTWINGASSDASVDVASADVWEDRSRMRPSAALNLVTLLCAGMWSSASLAQEAPAASSEAASSDTEVAEEAKESEGELAEEEKERKTLQDRIRAVSRRVFLKRQRFELVPNAGLTTNDPFVRAYPVGLRGSWHFNEELAVDFGGNFVPPFFQQELQDVRLLSGNQDELDPARDNSARLISTADVGVTFSPFYGKLALAAEYVLHFDGFISAGLGAVFDSSPQLVNPALEVGLGARVFLLRWLTIRTDLRNYVYPSFANDELSFPNVLTLTVGVGIHIPFDFDYSSEVIGSKE
jgi:outer membrane beta-barrel protein